MLSKGPLPEPGRGPRGRRGGQEPCRPGWAQGLWLTRSCRMAQGLAWGTAPVDTPRGQLSPAHLPRGLPSDGRRLAWGWGGGSGHVKDGRVPGKAQTCGHLPRGSALGGTMPCGARGWRACREGPCGGCALGGRCRQAPRGPLHPSHTGCDSTGRSLDAHLEWAPGEPKGVWCPSLPSALCPPSVTSSLLPPRLLSPLPTDVRWGGGLRAGAHWRG